MIPVQPGWIIKPIDATDHEDFYLLVGWNGMQPVIALGEGGIAEWQHVHGTDSYLVGIVDIAGWMKYSDGTQRAFDRA